VGKVGSSLPAPSEAGDGSEERAPVARAGRGARPPCRRWGAPRLPPD